MTMQKVERALTSSPATETVLNIFRSVSSTLPFTGGPASLISQCHVPPLKGCGLRKRVARAWDAGMDADSVAATYDVSQSVHR
jgi:hypothetical protein